MKNILATLCIMLLAGLNPFQLSGQCNPDIEAPTPICKTGITASLGRTGQVTIFASDIDAGSSDNCTEAGNLKFSFDQAGNITEETFTTEGTFQRSMYVTDEAGNVDFCQMSIIIFCPQALACNDRVIVNVPPGDSTTVSVWDVLEGDYCPDVVPSFSSSDPNDTLITVFGGPTVLRYTIFNITNGDMCWGSIVNCYDVAPVAIVEATLNVSLGPDGTATIFAETFDQGSFSNCGTIELFVKRFNDPGECEFGPNDYRNSITFCCKDIGKNIQVITLVRDDRGQENSAITEVIVEDKAGYNFDCATISGNVYFDDNDNCTLDNGEDGAEQVLVVATNGTDEYVTMANKDGHYKMFVDYETYDVYAISPGYYWGICPNTVSKTVDAQNPDVTEDFGMTVVTECPNMEVNLVAQRLRRCFANTAYLDYINKGTIEGKDARIELELDTYLELLDADAPFTDLGNNVYEFDLGDVPSYGTGRIKLTVRVDCDTATIGETQCLEARIFPDTICVDLLEWSGAQVEVEAECEGDSVRFTLTNTGTADMAITRNYSVIEDDVIMFMRSFKLDKEGIMSFAVEADGSTFRLNAEQEVNHPYPFIQSVGLEGCVDGQGSFTTGFLDVFPLGAQEPFKDIECLELIGSYDPNEKAASPEGYGAANYLEPGNPITYTLYFQNTGTDTAFNVFLLDTLSEHLDLKTFSLGASSHDVELLSQEGSTIRFDFRDIMLPDSFVNEPASNGFVQFTITPKAGLPLPTEITNKVGIYFDFNDPIITNTVLHTIDTGFLEILTTVDWWNKDLEEIAVSPNPTTDWVNMKWSEDRPIQGSIEILDLLGKTVITAPVNGNRLSLNLSGLHSGHYMFRITDNKALFATGKILISRP